MSLGERRPSVFRGKGCLISGLLVVAAFIGFTYYQQYQSRKQFWQQMEQLTKDMVRFSNLSAEQRQQAQTILDEMIAKGRDGNLSEQQQKRIVFETFLGSRCRLYMVLFQTAPLEMDRDLRARWDRAVRAFLFAVAQKTPTPEESEALDKAAPPRSEYTKDNRMKPEHIEKIVGAFDVFFRGRNLDPSTAPPFRYEPEFRLMVHRVAAELGHKDFWQDAVAATQPTTTRPATTRPGATQPSASRPSP